MSKDDAYSSEGVAAAPLLAPPVHGLESNGGKNMYQNYVVSYFVLFRNIRAILVLCY